jgi:hypothetical protein
MDASQLWYPEIVHSGPKYEFCTFCVSKVSEMLRNTPKHHFGSNGLNGCFKTLVPRNCAVRSKHKFCIFLRAQGHWNHLKHSQTSFWVQWTIMDASQLWYPEIVHSGPKYEFCTFYVSKVSEMLRNTRKHHFGSNELEWMLHNFCTPK